MYDEMGIAPVPGPGLTPGDTITFAGHRRWPWPVRFGAWLSRVELPPRPTPPTRQFIVSWQSDL